ncbi:uncharacterized protein LOC113309160 [Papaver somniferum]|nr:uncharacterized protein LOC113309160 [Papaver somniferum]
MEDWPECEGVKIKPPHLLREPGRPCVNRKRSWTEMNPEKKARHCRKCGGSRHNSRTCKGGEVGSNPKGKKARVECEVNGSSFTTTTSKPKKIPTGTKIRRSRASDSGKKTTSRTASSSETVKKTTSIATTKPEGKQPKPKTAATSSSVNVSIRNINKGPVKQTINNFNYDAGSKRQRKPTVQFDL